MIENLSTSQWLAQVNPQAFERLNTPVADLGRDVQNQNISFADVLNKIQEPAEAAVAAANQAELSLLSGEAESVHSVVLAAEKADVTLQLTMTVRNKVLEAYNEIMRMQL